jgi:hypothetical protein
MIGGNITKREGIIGVTLSIAYVGSFGGVTNGSENNVVMFSIPSSFPSTIYNKPNPNMRFAKNAPKRRIFVICQITKCTPDNLNSEEKVTYIKNKINEKDI